MLPRNARDGAVTETKEEVLAAAVCPLVVNAPLEAQAVGGAHPQRLLLRHRRP